MKGAGSTMFIISIDYIFNIMIKTLHWLVIKSECMSRIVSKL